LSDLVAKTAEEYVELALQLASDHARRAELRRSLRSMMLASTLTDAKRYVRQLEAGYREAWARWCSDQSPAHIDVPV
jgi:predicted O-linked N-acetylglucosamine transferase (SPINDLY family)